MYNYTGRAGQRGLSEEGREGQVRARNAEERQRFSGGSRAVSKLGCKVTSRKSGSPLRLPVQKISRQPSNRKPAYTTEVLYAPCMPQESRFPQIVLIWVVERAVGAGELG